jgi:hypothetical protein
VQAESTAAINTPPTRAPKKFVFIATLFWLCFSYSGTVYGVLATGQRADRPSVKVKEDRSLRNKTTFGELEGIEVGA